MPADAPIDAIVALAARSSAPVAGPKVIGIDGPSGSGKSTLAAAVAERLGAPLVPLEDTYPGWDGLDAGVELMVEHVLRPLAAGAERVEVPRWDWVQGVHREPRQLETGAILVLEGVGVGSASVREHLAALVWVEAPESVRLERALARDGETYRPHWERWAAQERVTIARERPREHADLIIDTSR